MRENPGNWKKGLKLRADVIKTKTSPANIGYKQNTIVLDVLMKTTFAFIPERIEKINATKGFSWCKPHNTIHKLLLIKQTTLY